MKSKMKINKKGVFYLLPVVLKILTAVIAIGLLILLFTNLIGIVRDKSEIEQAKSSLDILVESIEDLGEGEERNILLQGVGGWFIVGWGKDEDKSLKAAACLSGSCLCICEREGNKNSCERNGFCRDIDSAVVDVSSFMTVKFYGQPILRFRGPLIEQDSRASCIILPEGLANIVLSKKDGKVSAFLDYGLIEN